MIGDQIRTLRKAHHLSEVQLAKKLNVSKQSVSNWECNNIMPSVEQVKRMADLFGCSADYLLEMGEEGRIIVRKNQLSEEQAGYVVHLIQDLTRLNHKEKTD